MPVGHSAPVTNLALPLLRSLPTTMARIAIYYYNGLPSVSLDTRQNIDMTEHGSDLDVHTISTVERGKMDGKNRKTLSLIRGARGCSIAEFVLYM